MSAINIMTTTTSKDEEHFTKAVTSFPGLRPLEPTKAPAFWDAINFKIGTTSLNQQGHVDMGSLYSNFEINFDELSDDYDPSKGATMPVFSHTFDFSSSDENLDPREGIHTTSMTMVVDGAAAPPQFAGTYIIGNDKTSSFVPHSFPKPDPSCFVQYYAPLEPLILLPNHFSTTPDSLEKLSVTIEDYLKNSKDVVFSSSGSSWSGSILRTSCHCAFRFCVYKSRKIEDLYILEGQRVEGDGFLFGSLYQGVKALFPPTARSASSSASSVHATSENMDDMEEEEEETGVGKSGNSGIAAVNDLRNFAVNVKGMVNSEDSQVALRGIQFACEMCTDGTMVNFMYELDLVQDLFNVVKQRNNVGFVHERKWHSQHALIALSHLANKHTRIFNKYINEKMVGQDNLSSLLQVELDGIETDGFDGNSAAKLHMMKYSNSIRQKMDAL